MVNISNLLGRTVRWMVICRLINLPPVMYALIRHMKLRMIWRMAQLLICVPSLVLMQETHSLLLLLKIVLEKFLLQPPTGESRNGTTASLNMGM